MSDSGPGYGFAYACAMHMLQLQLEARLVEALQRPRERIPYSDEGARRVVEEVTRILADLVPEPVYEIRVISQTADGKTDQIIEVRRK